MCVCAHSSAPPQCACTTRLASGDLRAGGAPDRRQTSSLGSHDLSNSAETRGDAQGSHGLQLRLQNGCLRKEVAQPRVSVGGTTTGCHRQGADQRAVRVASSPGWESGGRGRKRADVSAQLCLRTVPLNGGAVRVSAASAASELLLIPQLEARWQVADTRPGGGPQLRGHGGRRSGAQIVPQRSFTSTPFMTPQSREKANTFPCLMAL